MSSARLHAEWLSLVEVAGPFLTLPVLQRALPHGLDPTDQALVEDLRQALQEFEADPTLAALWTRWVIGTLLGFPDEVLRDGAGLGPGLTYRVAEHGETLRPDVAVVDTSDNPERARLLVVVWPVGTNLWERPEEARWAATPVDRMAELCRATGTRLGLVTNGDTWVLVDALVGTGTATVTWDAALWLEERSTLDAFTTLLGVRRFFSVAASDTLEALLAESATAEAEVTDQLGRQVRAAVELLVDAMSRANREQQGAVFADLTAEEIYEAAVTVMMRLVFLLSAEERGLFLLGDETYDTTYAVSTLLGQLDEEANRYGEDVLERRTDAWHRLLATFRLVHGGAAHENLRVPAYGGTLFDPDRFAFLEGRSQTDPCSGPAPAPLQIDNRTIKHILDALQVLRFSGRGGVTEARRLSFRSLDVEQIGHVYEGLLDHAAVLVAYPALGLDGKKEAELALEEVEAQAAKGRPALAAWVVEHAGLTSRQAERALDGQPDPEDFDRLISACENDRELADRVTPFIGLLRRDLRGLPLVYLPDSYYVTKSLDRRSSGAYYTPRVLAEEIVTHTLEPLVYQPGPAEGADPSTWALRGSIELLSLRVCDMAMGSGAFLVAACRYLSGRLLEAWVAEEIAAGDPVPLPGGGSTPMPDEADREILARRLVADRCLFGVDRNPMAVEMAKLSMWLITLAKDQPFTFVDHALRCGDSLLGITDLRQLECFHLDPAVGRRLHGETLFDPGTVIEPVVKAALEKRRELESFPVVDVRDAEQKRRLLDEASDLLAQLKVIADLVVSAGLATAAQSSETFDNRLLSIADDVLSALDLDREQADRDRRVFDLSLKAMYWLDAGRPPMSTDRQCLHWALEFPEVFLAGSGTGFDAIVGNPPFMGSPRISETHGSIYNDYLACSFPPHSKQVDLCAYFFRRACQLIHPLGVVGLLATNSISEGNTRRGGLDVLLSAGWKIIRVRKDFQWPGVAAVIASVLWIAGRDWKGETLINGLPVSSINSLLSAAIRTGGLPKELAANRDLCFQGGTIWGEGFYLSKNEASTMLREDPKNRDVIRPALGGQELNAGDFEGRRWVIDFRERSQDEVAEYEAPQLHLERTIKEWRLSLDPGKYGRIVREWWKHFHARESLYEGIRVRDLKRTIARSRVSNYHMLAFVPSDIFYLDTVIVYLYDSSIAFGVLQSTLHEMWAREYGSRLKADLRYGAKNCFNTFPFPSFDSRIAEFADRYILSRARVMSGRSIGLTASYTLANKQAETATEIEEWRRSMVALDQAVADGYGWTDLDLGHGYLEFEGRQRFMPSPDVIATVLERLLEWNHERYAKELDSGLHAASRGKSGMDRGRKGIDQSMFE